MNLIGVRIVNGNQHGLGLVIKAPKRDYQRISILSKRIAYYNGEVIVLRLLKNTILTNAVCSTKIT